jgi:hypothetical protein
MPMATNRLLHSMAVEQNGEDSKREEQKHSQGSLGRMDTLVSCVLLEVEVVLYGLGADCLLT